MVAGWPDGKQDRAVAGERPEGRATFGPPGEAGRVRLEIQQDVGEPERRDRRFEPYRQPRPLQPAVEGDAERAIVAMAACPFQREGAVAPAEALRDQAEPRREDVQIGEMDDTVGAAGQVRFHPRQPSRHPGEEAIVHPPHPGVRLAGDDRPAAARARHRAQLAGYIDQAEARNRVARQRGIGRDHVDASAKVDGEAGKAAKLVRRHRHALAGEPACAVTWSRPSSRRLARIPPATSPTPVTRVPSPESARSPARG
jgi:hypothetical protein